MFLPSCLSSTGNGHSSTNEYDEQGYQLLLNSLKAPSEAKLLSFINKSKFRNSINEIYKVVYSENLDFEYFEVECMNGFGGRAKEDFIVVYWNGKAVLCDNMSPDAIFSNPEGVQALKVSLSINLGLEDKDTGLKFQ